MKKSEFLNWLQEEYQQWEVLLEQVGPTHMDQPGEFFDHFRDDHEADIRAWLARLEKR